MAPPAFELQALTAADADAYNAFSSPEIDAFRDEAPRTELTMSLTL